MSHSPPHLPRMPSNTGLISGPAVGAAQILIWSYSCVFLPPSPQLAELVRSLLWELSVTFYIFHRHSLPSDRVDLICCLCSWWEGSGSSSLATHPWVSLVVLSPPLHVGRPLGFAPGAALEDWGLPCEGQVWRWCSCLGRRGSSCTRTSGGLAARAAGNIGL